MQPAQPLTTHSAYPDATLASARSCLIWGWSLIGGACIISLIPVIGLLNFIMGPPLIVAVFILAIVAITKGRTGGGVALMLFSMIVAPLFMFLGQIVSLLGFGAAASSPPASSKMEKMLEPTMIQPLEYDPKLDSTAPNR
jgi:hypothetical protein